LRKKLAWASSFGAKKPVVGRKIENEVVLEMAASV
jgi:hypothetical protein